MSRPTAIERTASTLNGHRALLIMIMMGLLIFALTACDAARANEAIAPAGGDAAAIRLVTEASISLEAMSPDTETPVAAVRDDEIAPDRIYEWLGVIEWVDLDGGQFVIDRGCDRWALTTDSDEVRTKLRELTGSRTIALGIIGDASTDGRRTISVTEVFGPDDPRPEVALPRIPCPGDPAPANAMALNHSEVTLHGELVWNSGLLWLITDHGRVALRLPSPDMVPGAELPGAGNVTRSLGEYGVVGDWGLSDSGLTIAVRDIREWPYRNVAFDACGDGKHVFEVDDTQIAANGSLIRANGQWLLQTESGTIYVRPGFDAADLATASEPLDADAVKLDEARAPHQVVVIGPWKTDGSDLHMEAERFLRIETVCDEPARSQILPGEIAALGALTMEDGRPYLQTTQGRIVLLTVASEDGAQPQHAPGGPLERLMPEESDDANGRVPGEDGAVRPARQILAVGKWQTTSTGQLAIVLRYAIPWESPQVSESDLAPPPQTGVAAIPPVEGISGEPVMAGEIIMPGGPAPVAGEIEVKTAKPEKMAEVELR